MPEVLTDRAPSAFPSAPARRRAGLGEALRWSAFRALERLSDWRGNNTQGVFTLSDPQARGRCHHSRRVEAGHRSARSQVNEPLPRGSRRARACRESSMARAYVSGDVPRGSGSAPDNSIAARASRCVSEETAKPGGVADMQASIAT